MNNAIPSGKVQSRKGFGKLKAMHAQEGSSKQADDNISNETDMTSPTRSQHFLSLPLVKSVDRNRMLPRFSSILNRNSEEGVGMEDLDALQLELEALLSAVVVRSRALRKEIKTVNSAERRIHKKKLMKKSSHTTKQGSGVHSTSMNKLKSSKLRDLEKTPAPIKLTKVKSIPATITSPTNISLPEFDPVKIEKEESPKTTQSRYDIPNKFWASVDLYCSDISKDDIKFLKDLNKECDPDIEELKRIPPLGQHYSYRWAREDLMNEQKGVLADSKDVGRGNSPEVEVIFEKVKKRKPGRPPNAPLTQRLVSALMDENVKIHGNEGSDSKTAGGENIVPRSNSFRNYVSGSSSSFERRVRKGLEEEDVDINIISDSESDENDEIVKEIKRCQTHLRHLNCSNRQYIRRMIHMGEVEVKRQDLKKILDKIDNDIMENYRYVLSTKQRKKTLTKSEQNRCWELLKERSALIKQIDNLQ